MSNAPPSTVCFSIEDLANEDDGSELTGSFDYELSAESGLLGMQVRMVEQQERIIDDLASRLRRCELENQALKEERAAFVEELAAHARASAPTKRPEASSSTSSARSWFAAPTAPDVGSAHQALLVDANARLAADNARLQVTVSVLRKSFKKHIEDDRRVLTENRQTVKSITRRKNRKLLQKQPQQPPQKEGPRLDLSARETVATAPLDESFHTASWAEAEELDGLALDPSPSPVQEFGSSGDDWITAGDDDDDDEDFDDFIKAFDLGDRAISDARPLDESERSHGDLLVDFGPRRPQDTIHGRRSYSMNEGTARSEDNGIAATDDLLVNFGETTTGGGGKTEAKGIARRRWHSLKLEMMQIVETMEAEIK